MNQSIKSLFLVAGTTLLLSCQGNTRKIPSTYQIDGVTYKTGFYDGLFANSSSTPFLGDLRQNSADVWAQEKFDIGQTHGYKISYAEYEIVSILNGIWEYHLYVEEPFFNDAQNYYMNPTNFTYYWAKGAKYNYHTVTEIDNSTLVDNTLNALLEVSDHPSILYPQINDKTDSYFFYKISNDGLLTTRRYEYYVLNDNLLLFSYRDNDDFYCAAVDERISTFFLDTINNIN